MRVDEGDDVDAMLACCPMDPPRLEPVRKPLFEVSMEMHLVDPELIDLMLYGQSPGPHIVLGEE